MRLKLKFQRSVSIIKEEVSDAEDENLESESEDEKEIDQAESQRQESANDASKSERRDQADGTLQS